MELTLPTFIAGGAVVTAIFTTIYNIFRNRRTEGQGDVKDVYKRINEIETAHNEERRLMHTALEEIQKTQAAIRTELATLRVNLKNFMSANGSQFQE